MAQYPHHLYIDQKADYALDPASGNWEEGGVPFEPSIGDEYQGGKIFYIDSTGKHGLICTTAPIATLAWEPSQPSTDTGATDPDIGAGDENTDKILDAYGVGSYAAAACKLYSGGGYNDWFMPSKDELQAIADAGLLTTASTWSSTQEPDDYNSALYYLVSYAGILGAEKFEEYSVVAVRAF